MKFHIVAALVKTVFSGFRPSDELERYRTLDFRILCRRNLEQVIRSQIHYDKFVVMDLGANDLFQVTSAKDAEIKRPIPLQFVAGSESGKYRLYQGRDYVEFHRLK